MGRRKVSIQTLGRKLKKLIKETKANSSSLEMTARSLVIAVGKGHLLPKLPPEIEIEYRAIQAKAERKASKLHTRSSRTRATHRVSR